MVKLLAVGDGEIDVAKQLTDSGLEKLPYHLQCERLVWKIMEAENKAASAADRSAFAYINITAKEVLPLWLPQDAIGGRSMFGSEFEQADGSATTLAELGKALQAATTHHRAFRSFPQWLAAFLKYSGTAIAMKQLTVARCFAYMNVVAKIFEDEKGQHGVPMVAVLYDDIFRKTLAMRIESKDPELDLDVVFTKTDKTILECCKARIGSMNRSSKTPEGEKAQGSKDGSMEAHLAKQTAAAEGAAKKAEAATHALEAARTALNEAQSSGSKRAAKRNLWQAEQYTTQNKFGKKGKGGGKGKKGCEKGKKQW